MRHKAIFRFTVFALALFLVSGLSDLCYAQNYEQKYFLIKGQSTYELTLSVTHSLYDYYQQKSHQLTQSNFATFVTPYSLALVGADIRSIFPNDEDFANAVLMLVHQIPYQVVDGGKYPVETIVENKGDCDLLSYVAASLLASQQVGVVLLYYAQQSHMNIGISLPSAPRDARTPPSHVDYNGTQYYIAECTGDNWQDGWRVGELPTELEDVLATVVSLDGSEQIAPGQVSSSFGTLESSVITLTVSSSFMIEGNSITMGGRVSVLNPGGTVTLYAAADGNWFSIGTVGLDSDGRYVFSWSPPRWGQYFVKASWSGDAEHAGADSQNFSVYVIPRVLIYVGGGIFVATLIGIVVLLMHKTTQPQDLQPLEVAQ